MATRRMRSAHNNSGGGCDGSADSRSFPKFKPVKNHRFTTCQSEMPKPSPCSPPCIPPPKLCGRSHSIEQSQFLDGAASQCGRQICCSAHPDVTGCCSARPAVVRRRAVSDSRPRPYRPPPPLGGSCGRSIPLASLISIYNEPEYQSDPDFEGDEAWEEGIDENVTATHSCPLSSASPEARPCCCRRPNDHPQHMQVLLQSTAPMNANHTEETPKKRRQQRRQLQDLPRAKKASTAAVVSSESTPLRKRLVNQSPPTPPPPKQQRPQQSRSVVRQLQRPVVTSAVAAPAAPQHVRRVSQLMQPPRQPPQQQSWLMPWYQQQKQRQYEQQQQRQQQQSQSQQQQSQFRYEHFRSRSSPAQPMYNVKIYNTSNMESGDDGYHQYEHQEQQQQQQQQQQHIHRRPFAGLLRSRVSQEYNKRGRSSSASDF